MNFLLLAEKPTTLGYVFMAIGAVVLALIFVPHLLKKRKLEKYESENAEAGKDANLMFLKGTCPLCNGPYSKSEKQHSETVSHAALVGGTYFHAQTMGVRDIYYSCGHCGYRYYYAGHAVRTSESYQDPKHEVQYELFLEQGRLSAEDYARLQKAVEYDRSVKKMRKEINSFWS